jgi:gluconolactonase
VLIDKFDGKPLNSPNDVVVKSDDSIWFSDPLYGIRGNYAGHTATPELPTNVYRLDPQSGRASVVAGDLLPNGLCFAPDEKKMYLVDSSGATQVIRVYEVIDDGTKLANGKPFVTCDPTEFPDSFRCDTAGNLWCGWISIPSPGATIEAASVMVFNPEGKRIGSIALPEPCANLCFGGVKRNRLFMAASHSLYSLYVDTQGAVGG